MAAAGSELIVEGKKLVWLSNRRVRKSGDLFAPLLTLKQQLPSHVDVVPRLICREEV